MKGASVGAKGKGNVAFVPSNHGEEYRDSKFEGKSALTAQNEK